MTIAASQPAHPRRRVLRTLRVAVVLVAVNLLLVELGRRNLMVNGVHLTGAAKAIVARELARVIREQLAARSAAAGGSA